MIEAHLLFGIPFDRIEVVVHPTSVVHSMVEFVDGSTLVQASPPTMLIPIALGLAWPDRVPDTAPPVDWTPAGDLGVLPARRRGVPGGRAGPAGGRARAAPRPAVYNAANEVVRRGVPARAGWRSARSCHTVADVLGAHDVPSGEQLTVDDVLAADAWARDEATRTDRTRREDDR